MMVYRGKQIDLFLTKAYYLFNHQKFGSAMMYFKAALQADPKNWEAWYHRGQCAKHIGFLHLAAYCFHKSLEGNRELEEAWFNKGVCLMKLGEFSAAEVCFNNTLFLNPYHLRAYSRKASLYFSCSSIVNADMTVNSLMGAMGRIPAHSA